MAQNQWSPQQQAVGSDGIVFGIQNSPAIVTTGNQIFMCWLGAGGDGIYYSIFDLSHGGWAPQRQAGPGGSPYMGVPALATNNNTIAIAWANSGNIQYAFYDLITKEWTDPETAVGTDGAPFGLYGIPALGFCENQLFMAWWGIGNDGIYYSAFANGQWTPQQIAGGADGIVFHPEYSPSIAVIGNQILMTWVGDGGEGIFFSIYQPFSLVNTWSPQQPAQQGIQFAATYAASVSSQNTTIFMAWNGVGGEGIWTSQYDTNTNTWTAQQLAIDSNGNTFSASNAPAIAVCGNEVFMAWNAAGTDAIYFTSVNGMPFPASDWMSFLAAANQGFAAKTLRKIFLPGTHDAGMYTTLLLSFLGKTQDQPIFGQLMGGVRYFDLRPAFNIVLQEGQNPTWYYTCVHNIVNGAYMDDVLNDVAKYMSRPACMETVILKFSHYSNFNDNVLIPNVYLDFITKVTAALQNWLYTSLPKGTRLVDQPITSLQGKVIIVCDETYPLTNPMAGVYVYRGASGDEVRPDMASGDLIVCDSYSGTDDYNFMAQDQTQKYNAYNGYSPAPGYSTVRCDLYLLSWTLTPITGVWYWAQQANSNLQGAINALAIPNSSGMIPNIVYLDYYEYSSVIQSCYNLNVNTKA